MKRLSVSGNFIGFAMLVIGFAFSLSILPTQASAQSVSAASVQTGQILPPGQNTCQSVIVTDIQPHVYGGILESFDVTISDTSNSYVGIFAAVGNTQIPLNYITRWQGTPNGLMVHVDTPSINVLSGTSINLTLLSSPQGAPTCITTITFGVSGYGISAGQGSGSTSGIPSSSPNSYPSSGAQAGNSNQTRTGSNGQGSGTRQTGSGSIASNSATSSLLANKTSTSSVSTMSSICAGNNAYRLWFILLLIYIVIVAIVVFAEPWFLESSVVGSTAAILVPLILLLAFWYLSEACRAASWIPVVACVIAIVGLFLAFREYELPPLLPAPEQ